MIKILKLLLLVAIIWLGLNLFGGNNQPEQLFVIDAGWGVNQISQNLAKQNLIRSQWVFETWTWFKQAEGKMVAGSYLVPADISIKNLVNLFIIGPDSESSNITIIEGWNRNSEKFLEKLADRGFSVEEFLAKTSDKKMWEDDYPFLVDAPNGVSLEGYIFPDTYSIATGSSIDDLINKALTNFDRKLTDQMRADIAAQGKTIFEVVTMAAIIEREASQLDPESEDDNMVSDIFWKRLKIGMALQSDATVNFVTGKSLARPTLNDLEIDSPYNTYKYAGLPPGPIANPGISSLEAAIYPKSNPYYFYLNTPTGEFIYAENHDQHVDNKNKYLN